MKIIIEVFKLKLFHKMFRNISYKDLAVITLLLDEKYSDHKYSIWVHDILKKRIIDGEYVTLCFYKMLEDHEEIFFKYFRMTRFQLNVLLIQLRS